MIFIDLPIRSDVQLRAPSETCCNCGSTVSVVPTETDLRRMPLMGLVGAEIKVELPFPYCSGCAATARRRRPTVLGVVAISSLLALVLGMCWLFLGPQLSEEKTRFVVAPILIAISFAVVLGFYSLRKPKGKQSSYYQPIRLINTGHKWPADITGLELGFTNRQYAEAFSAANQAAIVAKKLKVSNA